MRYSNLKSEVSHNNETAVDDTKVQSMDEHSYVKSECSNVVYEYIEGSKAVSECQKRWNRERDQRRYVIFYIYLRYVE